MKVRGWISWVKAYILSCFWYTKGTSVTNVSRPDFKGYGIEPLGLGLTQVYDFCTKMHQLCFSLF